MTKFAAPLGLSGIAMFIINFGDRFILRPHVSFAELGLYALAYKIGMLISAAYASFQIYWSAQAYGIMRRADADHVFGRMTTYVVLGVAFCGLGVVAASKPVLRILAAPSYFPAVALVPLLVSAYCIRSIGEFFRCLFLVEGKPGYDAACTWVSSTVCLAGYFLLIPRFGVWGAAAATAITFIVFTAISVVWAYRIRPYRLEWSRLAKVAACVTLPPVIFSRRTR
jgi:O-antigen/teichoic acid export membrane protein